MLWVAGLACLGFGEDTALRVEVGTRASGASKLVDGSVMVASRNMALLSESYRNQLSRQGKKLRPMMVPLKVVLTTNGQDLPPAQTRGVSTPPISLAFDSSGAGAYSANYVTFLQSVLTSAKPLMDSLFGQPSVGGTVKVIRFDSSADNRALFFGGYYTPVGTSGGPEIHYPEISNPEAAAVNFIHCLLLAYLGNKGYSFDAWQEGLTRAVAMQIVREGGIPSSIAQQDALDYLLEQYDAGPTYDWINARALAANPFLAPNLRNVPLPVSGSTGGIFLLRYQAAGAALQKVLASYRFFARDLNQRVYNTPSLGQTQTAIVTTGKTVLTNASVATVEGDPFDIWVLKQHILNPRNLAGPKVLVAPTPITTGLANPDFGVFALQAYAFNTQANGNENLAAGVLYPIFWDPTFLRFRTSSQDNTMVLNQGSSAIGPNFSDLFSGSSYRAIVDLPYQDQIHRVLLPCGNIMRPFQATPNNLYGVITGVLVNPGDNLNVEVTGTGVNLILPVDKFTFGTVLSNTQLVNARVLTIKVVRIRNFVRTTLFTKVVNRGADGPLMVNLAADEFGQTTVRTVPPGISLQGFSLEPYESSVPTALLLSNALVARYDSASSNYQLGANVEPATRGHGYFINNLGANTNVITGGRTSANTAQTVALKPGWNLVTTGVGETVSLGNVEVLSAADDPLPYSTAKGTLVGLDFFEFQPGPNDAAAGSPQTGTLLAATQFEPNKAYFVRALPSEGAVLLFKPTSTGSAQSGQTQPSRKQTLRLDLFGEVNRASAFASLSAEGSSSINSKLDSYLPPTLGGTQIYAVDKGAPLFRQEISSASTRTFTFKMDGLKPGTRYMIRLASVGTAGILRVTAQVGNGYRRTLRVPSMLSFVAPAESTTIKVRVN